MREFILGWFGAFFRTLARAAMFLVRALHVVFAIPLRIASRVCGSRSARRAVRWSLAGVRVALIASLLIALALGVGWFCFRSIPPGTVGVKQVNFGGGGIVAGDHETGLAFGLRGFHSWHDIDRRTRVLTFAWESEGGDHPMLEVRTKDGNVAQVGVSIPWRVRPGEAFALVRDGLKTAYPQRTRATVEKVLLQELAGLSTDDLANTDARGSPR
jgi:regulator of protease activity HflC (stomatin/prohibitin superfamily)